MPSWKKVIVSGSSPHFNEITASGNISGSATSTGSFGLGQSQFVKHRVLKGWYNDNTIYDLPSGGDQGIRMAKPTPASGNSSLPIQFTNYFVEIQRVNNNLRLGAYQGVVEIYDTLGTQNIATFGTSGLTFSMGNISGVANITATGNISGSSTSTGSFGSLVVADSIKGGLTINQSGGARGLIIHAEDSSHSYMQISNTTTGTTTGDGVQFGMLSDESGFIGHQENNYFRFDTNSTERFRITADGDIIFSGANQEISASSTSTGSFGHLMVGGGNFSSASLAAGLGGGSFSDGTATAVSGSITSTGSFGKLEVGTNVRLRDGEDSFINGGDFGIGTTTPVARLEIEDNSTTNAMLLKLTSDDTNVYGMVIGNDTFSTTDTNGGQHIVSNDGIYIIRTIGAGSAAKTRIGAGTAFNNYSYLEITGSVAEFTTTTISGSITSTGSFGSYNNDFIPSADNTHDLGSATNRWANIHSADLQLNNENTAGNEVDGTTGNWTIQEGNDDLFIINRKTGKKYKFLLEEVK